MSQPSNSPRGMRTFLAVWIGQFVSMTGSALTSFALGVYIYEQTGSVTSFALNVLAYYVTGILLSPVAGVIADRYDRRLVMMLSDMLGGIGTLSVFVLHVWFGLPWWFIYIASALNSIANTFQWPAYDAATTMLVPQKHLGRVSGLTEAARAVAELIALGTAGTLYMTLGLRVIFGLDLATFVFSIVTLTLIRIPRPEQPVKEHHLTGLAAFMHDASFGLYYLRERSGLLKLLLLYAVWNFLFMLAHPLIPPMILSQTSPEGLGRFSAIATAGTLAGTIVMSIWGGPKRRIAGLAVFSVLCGVFNLLLGFAVSLPVLAAEAFGLMFTLPIINGCSQALWQSKVAADVQGRVFAVRRMVALSTIPLAMLLSGPLADRIFTPALMPGGALAETLVGRLMGVGPGRGIGLMLVLTSALYILVSSVALLHPRIRRVELELPDALSEAAPEENGEEMLVTEGIPVAAH